MSEPTPPKSEPEDLRFLLESKPFWREIKDQIGDFFFSRGKAPELVLESKPIPVKDIWSAPKSLKSRMGSVAVHLAVIGIMLLPFWRPVQVQMKKLVEVAIVEPPKVDPVIPKMRRLSGGAAPVQQAPKLVQAPQPHPISAPTSIVPLTTTATLPSFGAIGPVSGPPGNNSGTGGGSGGTGSGSADGTCVGNDCGDGVGESAPVQIYAPDPEYSEAARKAKFQGTCIVQIQVGTDGKVSRPVVVQPLGLGLDEKAVQAVLQWKFSPARDRNGKPVAMVVQVEVNFRLY